MKSTIIGVGAISLLLGAPALAAPSGPSGEIDLMTPTSTAAVGAESEPGANSLKFGGSVEFETIINGRVSSNSSTYVTVLCWQGENVVYQNSAALDTSFPLVNQAVRGLEWDGGAASCTAMLIYRVDKGKSSEITVLDSESFEVDGVPVFV